MNTLTTPPQKYRRKPPIKPLPKIQRTGVLKSRAVLEKHCNRFAAGARSDKLVEATWLTASLYETLNAKHPQRITPRSGAPGSQEIDAVVGILAFTFLLVTEVDIARNYSDQEPSLFEQFLTPILNDLGIYGGITDRIRKHIKARDSEENAAQLNKLLAASP